MMIEIPAEPFRRAIRAAAAVMKKKSATGPVLDYGLFRVAAGELLVVATNRDVVTEETLPLVRSDGDGDFAFPLGPLDRLLERHLADATGTVTFAADSAEVRVTVGPGVCLSVPIIDAAELAAQLPRRDVGAGCRWHVQTSALQRMLEVVAPRMATRSEPRAYLQGMYFHGVGGRWRGVASNGHTLAWADIPRPAGWDRAAGLLVPRQAIKRWQDMLARHLWDGPATGCGAGVVAEFLILTRCPDSYLRLSVGRMAVTAKLYPAAFPDYSRVLPAPGELRTVLTALALPLRAAVEQIEAIAGAMARAVSIDLRIDGDVLSVSSAPYANMSAVATVPVIACAGDTAAPKVQLNAHYFADALRACRAVTVTLGIDPKPETPIVIADPDDPTWQALIMRIRS